MSNYFEEKISELKRKADLAQARGDFLSMRAYDRQLQELYRINNDLFRADVEEVRRENRIWIVPENDLESKTIVGLLRRKGEKVLVTEQADDASWEKLENEIKKELQEALRIGKEIYGVELLGYQEGTTNIDHHMYDEDNRFSSKSSLEQVAEILEYTLSRYEMFVSANDKGSTSEMEKLGREMGINEKDLQEIIDKVRKMDRLARGVTANREVAVNSEFKIETINS